MTQADFILSAVSESDFPREGIPEVVFNGKTGYMVEPGEVDQLADAIEKMWSDQELCKEMGKNARKLMEDNFDKEHQFDVFLDYFRKITS